MGAFVGSIWLVVGHAVLKLTDLPVYDIYSINSSAQVGAAGGAVVSFPFVLITGAVDDLAWEIKGGLDTVLALLFMLALVAVGHELLHHANQPVMEIVDYVKAGLVGVAVVTVAMGLLFLMMTMACGVGGSMGWMVYVWKKKRITRKERDARGSSADLELALGSHGNSSGFDISPVELVKLLNGAFPTVEDKTLPK